jgi:hypothetical protein
LKVGPLASQVGVLPRQVCLLSHLIEAKEQERLKLVTVASRAAKKAFRKR